MRINKGNPFVFWPSSICETFPEKPSNLILSGDEEFSFTVDFTILEETSSQKTIFTLLPRYSGLDVHNNTTIVTITYEDGANYYDIGSIIKPFERYSFTFEHVPKHKLTVFINKKAVVEEDLTKKVLGLSDTPHIIFGAGNFPKNDFNLNYVDIDLHNFSIRQEGKLITNHNFEEKIFDKFVDTTNNLNFIHTI